MHKTLVGIGVGGIVVALLPVVVPFLIALIVIAGMWLLLAVVANQFIGIIKDDERRL